MALPRVFISSTYYDLKYIREDLERMVKDLGYDPIRHETGSIPYTKDTPLEESAYREVNLCDIIVCIIGGRYGSESQTRDGSITQNELKQALEKGIQVYIFIESNTHSEFSTYKLNKDNKNVKYRYVDNVKIYEFIESLYMLPNNNAITAFIASSDIINFLKMQWAGLFQHFLQEQRRAREYETIGEIKSVSDTLSQLVEYLVAEKNDSKDAINNILLMNHPAFHAFSEVTGADYRIFFTNLQELNKWLSARNYKPLPKEDLDADSKYEWALSSKKFYIKLTHDIFDEKGNLINMNQNEWQKIWLSKQNYGLSIQNTEPENAPTPVPAPPPQRRTSPSVTKPTSG